MRGSSMVLALSLASAAPLAPSLLCVAFGSSPVPFKGGTLAAWPVVALLPLPSDAGGGWLLPWAAWPAGVPAATELHVQVLVADATAPQGVSLSNLLHAATP